MRYHAKKSFVLMVTVTIMAAAIGFFMTKNYPEDGLYLVEVAPYFSFYLVVLIMGIIINRLFFESIFRLIYLKDKQKKPWLKSTEDLLAEQNGLLNVFLIALIGLLIACGLMIFELPLPYFFIALFLLIFACELTLLGSTIYYHRENTNE